MINFSLILGNPWARENFANLFNRSGMITEHKAWEVEVIRNACTVVELTFALTCRTDHAGVKLELGLFGYSIGILFYDTRHWDYKTDCWHNEEQNG